MDETRQVPLNEIWVNTSSNTKDLSTDDARDSLTKKSRLAISQDSKGNNYGQIAKDYT